MFRCNERRKDNLLVPYLIFNFNLGGQKRFLFLINFNAHRIFDLPIHLIKSEEETKKQENQARTSLIYIVNSLVKKVNYVVQTAGLIKILPSEL